MNQNVISLQALSSYCCYHMMKCFLIAQWLSMKLKFYDEFNIISVKERKKDPQCNYITSSYMLFILKQC